MKKVLGFILLIAMPVQAQKNWTAVEKGLELGIFQAPVRSPYGDSKIYVLRINPKLFDFELVLATENGKKMKTVQEWCTEKKLIACINAGMYDGKDPSHPENAKFVNRGYTQNFSHINSPTWTTDKAVIAFNRKDTTVPAFQIIDMQCQNINILKTKYNSLVQGIRMVDCKQTNRWFKDNKLWGMSLMAMDKSGNMLWIHTYSPYTIYNFTEMLLKMPLQIYDMIYLDGGIPSVFYLSANKTTVYRRGTYPENFADKEFDSYSIILPNVIGIKRKE
jgi:hypothetical protein